MAVSSFSIIFVGHQMLQDKHFIDRQIFQNDPLINLSFCDSKDLHSRNSWKIIHFLNLYLAWIHQHVLALPPPQRTQFLISVMWCFFCLIRITWPFVNLLWQGLNFCCSIQGGTQTISSWKKEMHYSLCSYKKKTKQPPVHSFIKLIDQFSFPFLVVWNWQ